MKRKTIKGTFGAKTDIGKVRVTNEDQAEALLNSSGDVLLCVCDGMGGHNKGDYASQLAVNLIKESFREISGFRSILHLRSWINKIVRKVNSQIYLEAENNPDYKDMGTTLVMAIIHNDDMHVINVGDSRAYLIKYGTLEQITEDQTYVDYLYKTGKITKEEMKTSSERHILMNALGTFPSVSFEYKHIQNLHHPVLLCSDGLYNNSTEKEIHSALTTNERVDQKIQSLIEIAKSNGGSDNIAVTYWEPLEND